MSDFDTVRAAIEPMLNGERHATPEQAHAALDRIEALVAQLKASHPDYYDGPENPDD